MVKNIIFFVSACLMVFACVHAVPVFNPVDGEDLYDLSESVYYYPVEDVHEQSEQDAYISGVRYRRSLQPGAPNIPKPGESNTNVGYGLNREGPNTNANVNVQHQTHSTDVNAGWSKVIRGPARAKPNWNVGVQHRW